MTSPTPPVTTPWICAFLAAERALMATLEQTGALEAAGVLRAACLRLEHATAAHEGEALPIEQAAAEIRVHPETLRRRIRAGTIAASKRGRGFVVRRGDLTNVGPSITLLTDAISLVQAPRARAPR